MSAEMDSLGPPMETSVGDVEIGVPDSASVSGGRTVLTTLMGVDHRDGGQKTKYQKHSLFARHGDYDDDNFGADLRTGFGTIRSKKKKKKKKDEGRARSNTRGTTVSAFEFSSVNPDDPVTPGAGGEDDFVSIESWSSSTWGTDSTEERKKARHRFNRYKPYFVSVSTLVMTAFMIITLVDGGVDGFPDKNPMIGAPQETLIKWGAKYVPLMRENGEYWRLVTATFVHAGAVHFILNMAIQLTVGIALERVFGWWRFTIVYLLSGIGGNILSGIFLPQEVGTGASGALYGLLGVALLDLIENWSDKDPLTKMKNKWLSLCKMITTVIFSLALGLLPGVDNFQNVGGFLIGFLAGIIFFPTMSFGRWDARRKAVMIAFAVPILVLLILVGVGTFYWEVETDSYCEFCSQINCLPIADWCERLSLSNITGLLGSEIGDQLTTGTAMTGTTSS